jgi:hypothetical protein
MGKETTIKMSERSVSTNSRTVLIGLLFLVGAILIVYTISVYLYTAEEAGRINSVFIAAITGSIALGGTLITQLWGGGSPTTSDKPVLYHTEPIDSAVGVPPDARIIASSNTLLDPTTINSKTFTLKDDTEKDPKKASVPGTVTLEGANAIFKPAELLKLKTKYTATIAKDVKDMSGRLLTTEKIWSFTTRDQ